MTFTNTDRYVVATAQAWDRLHLRLTRRAAWIDHEGPRFRSLKAPWSA